MRVGRGDAFITADVHSFCWCLEQKSLGPELHAEERTRAYLMPTLTYYGATVRATVTWAEKNEKKIHNSTERVWLNESVDTTVSDRMVRNIGQRRCFRGSFIMIL